MSGAIQGDRRHLSRPCRSASRVRRRPSEKDPDVDNVLGFMAAAVAATEHGADVRQLSGRHRTAAADQVIARLRAARLATFPARLFSFNPRRICVGGRGSSAQYQYTLQGDNLAELDDWAPRMLRPCATLPGVADLTSDQQNRACRPRWPSTATPPSRLGISPAAIDDTLYDAFGQRQVSTMYTQLNQYHVVMEVEPAFPQNPDGLKYLYIRGSKGGRCRSARLPATYRDQTRWP